LKKYQRVELHVEKAKRNCDAIGVRLKHINLFTTSNEVINFERVRINLSDSEIKKVHPNYWIFVPNRSTRPMLRGRGLRRNQRRGFQSTIYSQPEATILAKLG